MQILLIIQKQGSISVIFLSILVLLHEKLCLFLPIKIEFYSRIPSPKREAHPKKNRLKPLFYISMQASRFGLLHFIEMQLPLTLVNATSGSSPFCSFVSYFAPTLLQLLTVNITQKVSYELWFIEDYEKASVTDFFIPEGALKRGTTLVETALGWG